jgi:tRNA(His) 5'-end guanylyltransferase
MKLSPIKLELKQDENKYDVIINEKYILIRIDGHNFSKFTKGFKEPFDDLLLDIRIETAKNLIAKFNAATVYTQSDEFTLVIPHENNKTNKHIFNGRVNKLSSLVAAYASVKFNQHLFEKISDRPELENKVFQAIFDGRTWGVDEDIKILSSILDRVRDAEKNSKSMFARAYCTHSELMNKNALEQITYCKEKTGNDWNGIKNDFKYGTFIKKEKFLKENSNGFSLRSRYTVYSKKLEFDEEIISELLSQYK